MEDVTQVDRLSERIAWLIRLRWIAVAGVICTLLFVKYILNFSLPYYSLYGVVFVFVFYNIILYFLPGYLKKKYPGHLFAPILANVQISFDLLCLSILIHFSGGIENPFIFYFIFHMIIASILLSRKASFLQATYAVFLFLVVVIGEYTGILLHRCLVDFTPDMHTNLLYLLGVSFVFITTLYLAVYMATSISTKLREQEKSLQEANSLLQEKDRVKSEYVLRVSHDIKESLAAIQSCIEPVTEGITGTLNRAQSDLLVSAEERAHRLIFFVNALLEITRIKLTKKLDMKQISLCDIIKSVSQDIMARAQHKGVTFTVTMSPSIDTIEGVRVYIEEAILNLLANSVKYTPQGGTISFRIDDKVDDILIIVSDSGIGIPKDELPHIFEEFYRARNVRKIERLGTGLGLSITREIVEMHKGKIWFESEEGKGTTFYIQLPKSVKESKVE